MALQTAEVVDVVLLAVVGGLYWGPWIALTRSMAEFDADTMLSIVKQMNRNMAMVMTVLMPLAMASTIPVLVLSFADRPRTFALTLAGSGLYLVTLIVTVAVEVPIVTRIETWTKDTIPPDWQRLRDRWGTFHIARVVPAVVGLVLVVSGVVT